MKSKIIVIIMGILLFIQVGCGQLAPVVQGVEVFEKQGVKITNEGSHFNVVLDFRTGLSHREIGKLYAEGILEVIPNYEFLIDSYLTNQSDNTLREFMLRARDLEPQLPENYVEEIKGMASVFSGEEAESTAEAESTTEAESTAEDESTDEDEDESEGYNIGDGKISYLELLSFNVIPDIVLGTQCSAVSVFGDRSETGNTMIGRNLDWFGGEMNQTALIQSVVTYKYPEKQICTIGYLGFMGMLTGFSDDKVFAAVLVSANGMQYTSMGKCSYPMDLRYAMENTSTIEGIADYMKGHSRNYTLNHNIALADPKECKILENNISGYSSVRGERVKRTLRSSDSRLNSRVTWGIEDAIGCVNSFLLRGNTDNHSYSPMNTKRFKNMKEELLDKGDKVTFEELKEVTSYDGGKPGTLNDSGDLYNQMTLQSVVFEPESLRLEVYFHPKDSRYAPDDPTFEAIDVDFE